MRLLGYTRVSTTSQDARLQLDALTKRQGSNRGTCSPTLPPATGGQPTDPGMRKLLEYASTGDTIVVWRIDRLGRSLIDVLNTVQLLDERGLGLRSVQDGIDPATSSGNLMLNMLASLADYERVLITERVNAGTAAAQAAGTRFGRPPVNPDVIASKLKIVNNERAKGRTATDAARLVGWSRATFYRHQQATTGTGPRGST